MWGSQGNLAEVTGLARLAPFAQRPDTREIIPALCRVPVTVA
jgi:hypothetical protein